MQCVSTEHEIGLCVALVMWNSINSPSTARNWNNNMNKWLDSNIHNRIWAGQWMNSMNHIRFYTVFLRFLNVLYWFDVVALHFSRFISSSWMFEQHDLRRYQFLHVESSLLKRIFVNENQKRIVQVSTVVFRTLRKTDQSHCLLLILIATILNIAQVHRIFPIYWM